MGNFSYLRNLCQKKLAEEFARNILELPENKIEEAAYLIKKAESLLEQTKNQSTLSTPNERVNAFKEDSDRKKLHEQIIDELFTLPRLKDDESIRLGEEGGGALPLSGEIKVEKKAFIITGLPASGKSGIASNLSDYYQAIILDCDYAKRKIPEYYEVNAEYSANFVHSESSLIVMGQGNPHSLFAKSIKNGYNIIVPIIGYDPQSVYDLASALKKVSKYEVHLILIDLDRKKATQRAYYRFLDTKRYVPLSLIFDSYSNDPALAYYILKTDSKYNAFKSFTKISTDVPKGNTPVFVHGTKYSPIKSDSDLHLLFNQDNTISGVV